jgi:hypothetical protein
VTRGDAEEEMASPAFRSIFEPVTNSRKNKIQRQPRKETSRWYETSGVISIGAQCGGPVDNGLSDIKIDLWKLLFKHCTSSHCPSVKHFALALRIGGKFIDYTPECIDSIRRNNREDYIGADIVVPQKIWKGKTTNQLRDYLADRVKEALVLCVARLRKDKELVDEVKLFAQIDKAIELFRKIDYDALRYN